MTDETIKKINNCDYRIDDVDIEKNPLEWGYILTVRGWTTPKMHFYEENNNDAFIISGDDIPKRVGYKISLPQELLFHGNLERVIDFVLNSMTPDLCNGYNENKIIDKVYNFFMRRHTQI